MGIDKIGPRAPSGPLPSLGGLPGLEGAPAAGPVADPAALAVEDARAATPAGKQAAIEAPVELPKGFEPLPHGPGSEFRGPAGILSDDGRPLGGAEALRQAGGSISGADLARLHVLVATGAGSRIVRPQDIGLVAISAG